MTKKTVIKLMTNCKCQQDLREAYDKIFKAHNESYPKYWWDTFIESGLLYSIATQFPPPSRR